MERCINMTSAAFKDLTEKSGLSAMDLESRMNDWMDIHDTDEYPKLEDLKIDKSQLPGIEKATEGESSIDPNVPVIPLEQGVYTVEDHYELEQQHNIDTNVHNIENLDPIEYTQIPEIEENLEFDPEELGQLNSNVSLTNLTLQYKYQNNDLKKELSSLNAQISSTHGEERKILSKKIAIINLKIENIADRIKNINKVKNVQDVVNFGNEAIKDVISTLSNENITPAKLAYAKRLIEFWSNTGNFEYSRFGNPVFGNNSVSDEIAQKFIDIKSKMDKFTKDGWDENGNNKGTHTLQTEYIMSLVKKELGTGFTKKEVFAAIQDIGFFQENMFSLADYDNPLLTTVYSAMDRANHNGMREFSEINEGLTEKFKEADSELKRLAKGKDKYNALLQERDGKLTGDLVGIYSPEYNEKKRQLLDEAGATNVWSNYFAWSKKNEMNMDVRLLFPDERIKETFKDNPEKLQELVDAHKKELIKLVGQRQFDKFMNWREEEICDYNSAKNAKEKEFLYTPELDQYGRIEALKAWDMANSPYYAMDRRTGTLRSDGNYGERLVKFHNDIVNEAKNVLGIRSIPRDIDTDGNKTQWYDEKYKTISQSPKLLDLYNHIFDTMDYMRHIMPSEKRAGISVNALPSMKKSIIDSFGDSASIGMTRLWENMQKSFMVNSLPDVEYNETDISTGKAIKNLKVHTMMISKHQIQHMVDLKAIEYQNKTGNTSTPEDIIRFKQESMDEINQDRSFDLPKILQVYAANLITYKHKADVVDLIKLVKNTVENDLNELAVSNSGVVQKDSIEKNPRKQIGLDRLIKSLDYQTDVWMGYNPHLEEGVRKEKTLTSTEKNNVENLIHQQAVLDERLKRGEITEEYRDASYKTLDDEINRTGGHLALSKVGDNFLKYVQMKSMSFNYIAGGVNLLTGWVENCIRAADGRFYSTNDVNFGYKMSINAVLDPFAKLDSTKKMVALEKVFDVLHMADRVRYGGGETDLTSRMYVLTTKSEFVNAMTIAAAYLRNIPVTNDLGTKATMFDAFDKNGKIKDGWKLSDEKSNNDFLFDVKSQMDRLVIKARGNYKDPMMAKEYWIGRAALQFKAWMPEMAKSRWGSLQTDYILKKEFKGRWRSFGTLGGSKSDSGDLFTAGNNVLYTLGQLAKQITFQKTSFQGRMSEVDAANMQANMMELHFVLGTLVASLGVAMMFSNDEKKRYGMNMAVNLLLRQQADIVMFANPEEVEQLSKNIMPVMGIITDTSKLLWSIKQNIKGDGLYNNSAYKGINKSLVAGLKMFPGGSQILRGKQYNEKTMDK